MITTAGHTIKEIRLRGKIIGKVMQGDKVVYQRSRLDTTPSLSFAAAGESRMLSIDCTAGQAWTLSGIPAGWSASATSGTGPTEVTLTAPNNTSTQAVAGTIAVVSEGKTVTCRLSQAAGAKVYGDIVIGTYSYGVIPAGGGSVSPSLSYSQPWTWNGVSGSGGTVTSGAGVSHSGAGVDASTGAVSAASKGTTVSGQTTVATATVTVTLNGKSGSGSATVYQEANAIIDYPSVAVNSFTYGTIPYTGGSVTPQIEIGYTTQYTSGAELEGGYGLPPGYTARYARSGTVFIIDTDTGVLSVGENTGTTTRSVLVTVSVQNPDGAKVASKMVTVKQESNPGPVTVHLYVSTNEGKAILEASPKTYDALQIVFSGTDVFGTTWTETKNIMVGAVREAFAPAEAATGAVNSAEIYSVESLTNPPYTTENAIYYWGFPKPE